MLLNQLLLKFGPLDARWTEVVRRADALQRRRTRPRPGYPGLTPG